MFCLPARAPHAEPSDAAYHVYCPRCQDWVGGACLQRGRVICPKCRTGEVGFVQPELLIYQGRYAGRPVKSMQGPAERDFLDQWLHEQVSRADTGPAARELQLAILAHLGWLDARRLKVSAGPDISRYERAWRAQQQPAAEPEPVPEAPASAAAKPVVALVALDSPAPWWAQVLYLPRLISPQLLALAYRTQSKREHPDVGGSHVRMQRLNEARAAALQWLVLAGK